MIQQLKTALARRAFAWSLGVGNARQCPICDWTGRQFLPYGIPIKRRYDSRCPNCKSLERHRLVYVVLHDRLSALRPETLHIAPEACIERWLRSLSTKYVSGDIDPSKAMMQVDITRTEFPDNSFSLIWCSNVLEHIPDDGAAMREMFRICKPDGVVIVQVPIWRVRTYENASITTEEQRLIHFYQEDHVRLYGLDVAERLEQAGFSVDVKRAQDLGPSQVLRGGLSFISTNEVFVCSKS